MFLALDVGNTFVKIGIYEEEKLIHFAKFKHNEFSANLIKEFKITNAAISSVVPSINNFLISEIENNFKISPLVISHNLNLNLKINYNPVESLGIDRICASEGAFSFFKNQKNKNDFLLIIDSGTATTLNLISLKGEYLGGIIMPGIYTMINSLNKNTAQLPKVNLEKFVKLISNDTSSAIASGVINSTVGLIEKVFNEIKNEFTNSNIHLFLTGGSSLILKEHLKYNFNLVEDLVLRGVKRIFEINSDE